MTADDSQFYTGLVAEAYSLLAAAPPDPAPYEHFVRRGAGPALELACGDGRPMLDLVAAGLDVEGLDSSADMLDRCRAAARDRGLDVTLHLGDMADFDLDRTFASIYLAGASITLLPDDAAIASSLACMAGHLEPGGRALVPFWIPDGTGRGRVLEAPAGDGTDDLLRCTTVSVERDDASRTQSSLLRYERLSGGHVADQAERWWNVHWLTVGDALGLAGDAGFASVRARALDGEPAAANETLFTLTCQR